ncbi:MAG: autotransporter assembly complex family protein [Pseudomonadota bacterium]
MAWFISVFFVVPGPVRTTDAAGPKGLDYQVSIQGMIDPELKGLLERVSETVTIKDRPPASLNLLKRRVAKDIPLMIQALRSQGFYGAGVESKIETEAVPVKVLFMINPGPPYTLKFFDVRFSGDASFKGKGTEDLGQMGMKLGEPVKGKSVLDARDRITGRLQREGFPFPKVKEQKVIVDHADRSVAVRLQVDTGPPARFGATQILGLVSVDEPFLQEKIPWKPGDLFNRDLLVEAGRRFNGTGLFTTVEAKAGDTVSAEGRLPVMITVTERKHRTVKTGLSYKTDEGPGAGVSWAHRNFFGSGESLETGLSASGIALAAHGQFTKRAFRRPDQSLHLKMQLAEDSPDAYTSRNLSSEAGIERVFKKKLTLGAGIGFRLSNIEQFGEEKDYRLIYLPGTLVQDTSDDLLNPVRGGRLHIQLTPYVDVFGQDISFLKGYGSYSRYLSLTNSKSLVLASRVAFGTLFGTERDELPADLRFYAGGGGSVRGYAYQTLGPMQGNEPLGGRSLMEVSGELRARVTDKIGAVLFLDGGGAYADYLPDFGEDTRWAAGVGFRYFTKIGPLRLDVGLPLDRREGIDDSFQIYVSLGQAF